MWCLRFNSISEVNSASARQCDKSHRFDHVVVGSRVYFVDRFEKKVLPAKKAFAENLKKWLNNTEDFIPGTQTAAVEIQGLIFRPWHSGGHTTAVPVTRPVCFRLPTQLPFVSSSVGHSILRRPGARVSSNNRVRFAESVQSRIEMEPEQNIFQKNFAVLQARTPAGASVVSCLARFSGSNLSPAETHVPVINPLSGRSESGRVHANKVTLSGSSKKCIVVQAPPPDKSSVEWFWQMIMQQRPATIVDLLRSSRLPDTWRSGIYCLPRAGRFAVGDLHINVVVSISDPSKMLYQLQDIRSGETHKVIVKCLRFSARYDTGKGIEERVKEAPLVTGGSLPMIYCNNNGGEASMLLATNLLIDRAKLGQLSRSMQPKILEEVILALRCELGPQAIGTANDYTTLNRIYTQLLNIYALPQDR